MKKNNLISNVTHEEENKSTNIALLKNFLADMSVKEFVALDYGTIELFKELLESADDGLLLEKYFPNVAIAEYNNVYGQPVHRIPITSGEKGWSDEMFMRANREYIRLQLIPACRTKAADMLQSKAFRLVQSEILPINLKALKSLLHSIDPSAELG